MNKAILVLDEMPEDCENCPLENKMYISCIVICRRTSKFKGSRPDWCPLRPMPEKQDDYHPTVYGMGYERGWNDAIKAIEGSGEDG